MLFKIVKKALAFVAFGMFAGSAFAANEIHTLSGRMYGNPGSSYEYANIQIKVQNLSSSKSVIAHWTNDGGSTWADASASYISTNADGYENWEVNIGAGTSGNAVRFATKLVANGNTYWDSNGGSDYTIPSQSSGVPRVVLGSTSNVIQQSPFVTGSSDQSSNYVSGYIYLRNIAYTKVVKIRYTTNNWTSYTEVDATFNNTVDSNFERWAFEVAYPLNTTIKYAISYTVSGSTYWDNNLLRNYQM